MEMFEYLSQESLNNYKGIVTSTLVVKEMFE